MDTKDFFEIAHHHDRPNSKYYIETLFPDFIEISGDRLYGDDPSIIGGIATINDIPTTVIGQLRGRDIEERIKYNFSMSKPEGYRKTLRLMKQAEKFERPIICFVDTLGAHPGKEAEERGQGNAIANCLMECMYLKTPIISILIGDGGSGGALALCVADVIIALEYATLSIITPKACANILWNDSSRYIDAAELLKMKAINLFELGVIDEILSEPQDGAQTSPDVMVKTIQRCLVKTIERYMKIPIKKIMKQRKNKYNEMGKDFLVT